MNSDVLAKVEQVRGKLMAQGINPDAIHIPQGEVGCDESRCEDSGLVETTQSILNKMVLTKTTRLVAFQQLLALYNGGHIKESSPLDLLITELLGRERRYQ